jgi:hypothetical protein
VETLYRMMGENHYSSFPETFVHLLFLILIQWGAVCFAKKEVTVYANKAFNSLEYENKL